MSRYVKVSTGVAEALKRRRENIREELKKHVELIKELQAIETILDQSDRDGE